MANYQHDSSSIKTPFLLAIILFTFLISFSVVNLDSTFALALAGVMVLFLAGFLKTEWALYFLILSMLLSPEIILGGAASSGSTEGSRALMIRFDDLFILIIGISWLAKTAVFKELGIFLKTPLNRPILYYILACFFSTTLGYMFDRVTGLTGFFYVLKYIEYFIIYFVVVNNIQDEDQLRRYVIAILITCIIVCVIGILQIPEGRRVSAPFEGEVGEPNTLGGYLVLILSIVLGLFLCLGKESNRERVALGIISVLIIVPLGFTLSRSSWLALFPMILVLLIWGPRKPLLISILILAGTLGMLIVPPEVTNRLAYTLGGANSMQLGGVNLDTSSMARIMDWQRILGDVKNHPFLGYGISGYSFVDGQYFKILIELGILGFMVFSYLLTSIFRYVLQSFREVQKPLYQGLALGMLAGTAAIATHAIVSNTFIIIRIMEPFWFLLAIVMVLPEIEKTQLEE